MVSISEVSFKIRKIARFYDLDHITTTTTTTTTGYLQKFKDGLQILAARGQNRSKKFLNKSLMPAFLFLRIYEDFSYKSSSMKSVRAAAIMFVSVARHHSVKHLRKCAQLLRFSISLKFKNLHRMLVSVRLYLVHLDLP